MMLFTPARVDVGLFETFGNLVFGNEARLKLAGHQGIPGSNPVYQFVMQTSVKNSGFDRWDE
ncbi:MAG: hypothetical protein ACJZ6C_05655 [Candidatus Poriferisodalaceae bacterium]